jgi:MoaA/NifB/PqqE/SkfB family radical SAM enzyme
VQQHNPQRDASLTRKLDQIVKNEVKVSVSIDGGEATNDLVRGKGAYAASVKTIERLSRENLLNCLVYTLANVNDNVSNVNEKDFGDVLDLAEKYGARWVIYHGMIPYSKDPATLKACPSPAQYEWAWNKLYDLNLKYKGKPAVNVYYPTYARVAKQRGIPDWDNGFNRLLPWQMFLWEIMSIAENGDALLQLPRRLPIRQHQRKSLQQNQGRKQTSESLAK